MKKNKFTSIAAVISSIALVGSMASLPAYATENNTDNTALVSQVDDNATNENTTLVSPVDDSATNEDVNTEAVTASPTSSTSSAVTTTSDHSHENEASDFVDDPNNLLPANVQTGQDAQQNQARIARAAVSTFGTTDASSSAIDASDLSTWAVFDHYDRQEGNVKPADWDTTVNSDGQHPWYYFKESQTKYHTDEYYDVTGAGTTPGKTEYIEKVLNTKPYSGKPAAARVSNHIFTMGSPNDAEIYFTGYGSSPYLDFALTKTPASDRSLKSIAFDIDAAAIYPHTTVGFGFFVNAGVSGNIFKGQAINFRVLSTNDALTGFQTQIVDLSNGTDASVLHSQYNLNGTNLGTPISIPSTGMLHLDIQADNDKQELTIEVTSYSAPNVLDQSSKQVFTTPLKDTGYQAFGPYVGYSSHGCPELSWMKFGNIQLSSNLDVYFWTNPNNGDKGENFAVIQGIEKGNSINATEGQIMPSAPRQAGKSFKGWNTQADGNGRWFTGDTQLTNTSNVYAIWSDTGVNVTYGKTDWTKDPVDVNIIVSSLYPPEKVVVQFPGEPEQVITVTQNPSNPSEFIGKVTVDSNKTGGKVIATVPDGQGGFTDLDGDINVTLIDKEAPVIDNLPKGSPNHALTFDDMSQVKFTDPKSPNGNLNGTYSSGVKDDSRTVYFFQNGQIVKETPWANLEQTMKDLPAGKYDYAISVTDNVGNYNDSNGTSGQPSNGPKPEKPTIKEVIINPVAPTIQPNLSFKDGSGSYDGSWTNKDVVVDYTVTDSLLNLNEVKENNKDVLTSAGLNFDKNFNLTKSGTYTYDLNAKNQAGLAADEKTVTVRIDKDAPVVTLPAANTVFTESAFNLEDALSGVDTTQTKLVAVPYVNGKLSTDPSQAITINDITSNNWSNGQLTEGVVYKFTLTGTDKAGNTASKTVDKIQYIQDPNASSNQNLDLWGEKMDGGKYKISVDSKTYPIQTLSISIAGGAEQVIPITAGSNYVEFVQSMPINQIATIKAKLAGGSIVTGTFNPLKPLDLTETKFAGSTYQTSSNRPAKAAVKTLAPKASSIQALNTSPITGTNFKAAVAGGFELTNLDNSKTTFANPTVQYMGRLNGTTAAYKLYPNPTLLFTSARNSAYDVILVVTIPGQGTFYVSGDTSSTTAPSPNDTGYVIKGV